MARQKRTSKVVEQAQQRAASLASISHSLDLGNNLSLTNYTSMIINVQTRLDAYNTALSAVDAANRALEEAEKELASMSEHMLIGVAYRYGKNSGEYQMAGGVRKSDRKRPTRRRATVEAV